MGFGYRKHMDRGDDFQAMPAQRKAIKSIRMRIFEIIELSYDNDKRSRLYDYFMILTIVISFIPLAFKTDLFALQIIDKITISIFVIDYMLRLCTADFKYQNKGIGAFLKYPFSFYAIIDLISILPTITILNSSFQLLRLFRMAKAFRVLRVFKALRYSKSFQMIMAVLNRSKEPLTAVGTLAIAYIIITALIIFNVEPDSFHTFFDAVYWATVSLTTVGYGDIYPITTIGRIITMASSLFGIAIIALPAGIITAGYMNELAQTAQDSSGTRL